MTGALEGIRVADFGWFFVVPTLTKYLAEHGAEVVRIESETHVCGTRISSPYKDGIPGLDRTPVFAVYNDNKYGIGLNLSHPRAAEVTKRIIAWADVLVEGFTPGTMERLGLGYEDVKRIRPGIIMVRASMQGQTGPKKSLPALGLQLTGLAGISALTGWPDRDPCLPFGAYTDMVVPPFGAAAIVAALDYRRSTGKGQCIDISQYEVSLQLLAPVLLDYSVNQQIASRAGNRCSYAAPHGAYPCRGEDRWCAIAVYTDDEWKAFCRVIGSPPWTEAPEFSTFLSRKQNEDELDRLVAEWSINFTAEQVMAMMQAAGVHAGVVQTMEDIYNDPQLKHRGHFVEIEHPVIGKHYYDGTAFRLSKTPSKPRMPGPCFGEHNEYFCTKVLGISDDEFVELLGEGVFE